MLTAAAAARAARKTMKQMALEALQRHPDGLEARAILAWIRANYDLDLSKESFSPQLSRLGQEGAVTRLGSVWRLATVGATAQAGELEAQRA